MATQLVKDPVCGMEVDPATAAARSDYKGATYYFCSGGCKVDFDKDPDKYLDPNFVPAGMPDEPKRKPWWQFWRS